MMLLHCRMGHLSFDKMFKVFPDVTCGADKDKLFCDACEFAKHTRTSYASKGMKSVSPFVLVHSDVWTCPVVSISGMKYFVTFIDCFSRMTWVYLMKHKDEVLKCFQDFCALVKTQFHTQVKVLRTDNGTEYVNKEFSNFLSTNGILHQTTCLDTPPQNGVAERKNRHILKVARSLMFTMNVPKFLWSEAVLTATYLINRTPSRVLGMKTPCEVLLGENKFVVPPKVFGCTCFVRDHRPSVGKLDPRAIKCIFVGYFSAQKGYKCWSPNERRLFVSMDVTFREYVPFYGNKTDLNFMFEFGPTKSNEVSREGENDVRLSDPVEQNLKKMEAVISGSNPPVRVKAVTNDLNPNPGHGDSPVVDPRYKGSLKVYVRRKPRSQEEDPATTPENSLPAPLDIVDVSSTSEIENDDSALNDMPIALRKGARDNAGVPPTRYGFEHDISNYVSYGSLSPAYRTFVASLQSVTIPRDWKQAKQDPKWHEATVEELRALEKNKTWELVKLPAGKKAISCKWVFTIKQNPEGKVERYKARLVARGYSQTYSIDYDETFSPVAKMGTVRTLISCAANFGWPLHQLDVKNAFLHGDLQEEVYMEIPPGFSKDGIAEKVCRLKKIFVWPQAVSTSVV